MNDDVLLAFVVGAIVGWAFGRFEASVTRVSTLFLAFVLRVRPVRGVR